MVFKVECHQGWGHYSLNKIRCFIDQFGVDMSEYLDESLFSYESFVTRVMNSTKRPVAGGPAFLVAVADSRLFGDKRRSYSCETRLVYGG